MAKERDNQIAFKLDPALLQFLQIRAKAEGVESPSLYAKNLVRQALDQDSELALLRTQVEDLSGTLAELREDLRNVAKALLVAATSGTPVTPAQAEQWAKLHFPNAEPSE